MDQRSTEDLWISPSRTGRLVQGGKDRNSQTTLSAGESFYGFGKTAKLAKKLDVPGILTVTAAPLIDQDLFRESSSLIVQLKSLPLCPPLAAKSNFNYSSSSESESGDSSTSVTTTTTTTTTTTSTTTAVAIPSSQQTQPSRQQPNQRISHPFGSVGGGSFFNLSWPFQEYLQKNTEIVVKRQKHVGKHITKYEEVSQSVEEISLRKEGDLKNARKIAKNLIPKMSTALESLADELYGIITSMNELNVMLPESSRLKVGFHEYRRQNRRSSSSSKSTTPTTKGKRTKPIKRKN